MALAVGLLLSSSGPLLAQDSAAIEYEENRTDPVATYTAVDQEGQAVYWSLLEAPREC